ncbi:MAG: hypothetical protein ACTHMZ_01870 [Actinomycetes bacterium]
MFGSDRGDGVEGTDVARPGDDSSPDSDVREPLWHVVVTVSGPAQPLGDVKEALERLSAERPFLLSCRYGEDRAEVRYWEEARDLDDAAALALRLWGEHRTTASLPPWTVTGIEVLSQHAYQQRVTSGDTPPALVPAGGIRPFDSSRRA